MLRVEESVAAARERLDAGAYEASVSASRVTMDRADQAGAVGVMIVAAAVLALLLLLALVLLLRRSRRRRSYRPTHLATHT